MKNPNPTDWADFMESETEFEEWLNRLFNLVDIHEADYYTPKVLEDTYLNMELAFAKG